MESNHQEPFVVEDFPRRHRSMRIATVTETYKPEINGVALTVARIVEGLRELSHEVQVIRPRQADLDTAALWDEDGSHDVLTGGVPIPMYSHLRMGTLSKRRLLKLWTLHRPDVVHVATEGPLGWSALQAARVLQIPVCADFRTNFHAYSQHYGLGWLRRPILAYLRKLHNRADCTLVPTEALRQELQDLGFHRLRTVARGVDTQRFDPARRSLALRAKWGASESTPVLLCVGRMAPEKNMECLIQTYEKVLASRPDAKLVLVGDGPLRQRLQQRCEHAIFEGFMQGDALAQCYASADVFVFPSLTETYGNVTPEAMASGLAVVAYDYAAAAQLILHHQTGCLVPVKSASQSFEDTVVALVCDLDRARAMGRAARSSMDQDSWLRVVRQVESVLSNLVESATPQQGRAAVALESRRVSVAR